MNKKIIVALDGNNIIKIKLLVSMLKSEVFAFKIGYEFFLNFGLTGYNEIKKISPKIFLDLKLHDIPNTVKNGVKAIEKLNPVLTTIHISGGDEMQKVSVANKKRKVKILGVSILTSLDSKQTKKYYNGSNIDKLVKNYAIFAKKNKLDGIVCSPLEIKLIKKIMGSKFLIVVPGIRPKNYKKIDDQKRFISPKKAISLGASLLVIGRPITESKNPLKIIKQINKSIS
tara:strand:- start:243 stop:926 length:684 start_codon:yes stop_codon:yes gene_type:complete